MAVTVRSESAKPVPAPDSLAPEATTLASLLVIVRSFPATPAVAAVIVTTLAPSSDAVAVAKAEAVIAAVIAAVVAAVVAPAVTLIDVPSIVTENEPPEPAAAFAASTV